MASAVIILDQRGKILISRNYRGDISVNVATRFIQNILQEEEANVKPIIVEDNISYVFVKLSNLYCILMY